LKKNTKEQINYGMKLATTMIAAGVTTVATLLCLDYNETDPGLAIVGMIAVSALVWFTVVCWIKEPGESKKTYVVRKYETKKGE